MAPKIRCDSASMCTAIARSARSGSPSMIASRIARCSTSWAARMASSRLAIVSTSSEEGRNPMGIWTPLPGLGE